jgi:hypothetical protein
MKIMEKHINPPTAANASPLSAKARLVADKIRPIAAIAVLVILLFITALLSDKKL